MSSPSPNKSVSNLSTDTPMSPHPLPPLMPPLLRNKNLANIDHQNLCRSIVGCHQRWFALLPCDEQQHDRVKDGYSFEVLSNGVKHVVPYGTRSEDIRPH